MEPVTKLKLADHLFAPLLAGEKVITIREGARLIAPGPLTFESVSGTLPEVTVDVFMTVIKRVGDLTDAEALMDGYPDAELLVEGLRQFYPHLGEYSVVTLAAFDLP